MAQKQHVKHRAMMTELAARSLHDQKVVGSNPAGSNSGRLVNITRIDGYQHTYSCYPIMVNNA